MQVKTCYECKIEKPINKFKFRTDTSTYRGICKPCQNAQARKRPNYQKWHRENKHIVAEHSFKAKLKKFYNLTMEQYKLMRQSQNDLCASCGELKPLVIDHCHKTGKVRGLLCVHCNCGLGAFYDTVPKLESAIKYLQKHK